CHPFHPRRGRRLAGAVGGGNDRMGETPQNTDRSVPERAVSKHVIFEPVALVLLSLATVGTAWCSFQAAVWGGVSQRTMNLSAAAGRRAAADQLQNNQMGVLDVMLFSEYINARASSNDALARFYS